MDSKFTLILAILVLLPLASSSYIYGDIYVDEEGYSNFFLESDVPLSEWGLVYSNDSINGKSYDFTSKSGGNWTFNLDWGVYENILIDVHLPKNTKAMSSIKGVERIVDFDEKIITLVDKNKELKFSVDYNLKDSKNYSLFYFLAIFLLFGGVSFIIFKVVNKKKQIKNVFPFINENEQKIVEVLMKGPMRQKQVREHINIPKASFTRYLVNLEKKRLLIREGDGKNKVLKLR